MREIESILAAENSRLRAELERLRQQPQPTPIIIQQPAQVQLTTHTQCSLSQTLQHTLGCDNVRTLSLLSLLSAV